MRHLTPVESPRSAPSSSVAAALQALPQGSANIDPLQLPDFWRSTEAAEASDAPPLPDVEPVPGVSGVSNIEALQRARNSQWAPPFAWARAMEMLFELGMGNMEDARAMRGLAYTAAQQAKRESLGALKDRISGQRAAAFNNVGIASMGAALTGCALVLSASGAPFSEGLGHLAPGLSNVATSLLKWIEMYTPGTGRVNEAEVCQKAWEAVAEPQGKIERACDERLQQNQRNLGALLDMLLQLEQKRGQVVSQINTNV